VKDAQPVLVAQEVVHVVGKDQLFELEAALAKLSDKLDGLTELLAFRSSSP
jgi:hypothetical protein